jgi:mannitol-1-phosphate 5-dehydrogenase
VDIYATDQPSSLHRIIAAGLRKKVAVGGPQAVIYTAENNNHAAEILKEQVIGEIPIKHQSVVNERVRFLNTVIGKMSQVLTDPEEIRNRALAGITPDIKRAFLVEAFNRILISKIQFDQPFDRGMATFIEKEDLLPFEEAKLYGHNAVHALGGYLGSFLGLHYMADLKALPGMMDFLRKAFIEEAGQALMRKYHNLDYLFTMQGFEDYVDDLLQRMMNPFLLDRIERVTRDPARKLGWNDRLIGTMRMILNSGRQPVRFALGAAGAFTALHPGPFSSEVLDELWRLEKSHEEQKMKVTAMVEEGWNILHRWQEKGDIHRVFDII